MRHYKTLTWNDRLKLEALLKANTPVKTIARVLYVHTSTIYREIKRGTYEHRNTDWTTEKRYSPEISEQKKQDFLCAKGRKLKIGNDIEYAKYPKTTFYRYIENGVFLMLTNKDLPVKKNKSQRKYNRVKRAKRSSKGDSIEKRPLSVLSREEFGHWEMDCVEGKKGTNATLLVLTERTTRMEIIRLMPAKTAENVVRELNKIERKLGKKKFSLIFKTITVDNGSEFSDTEGIENSLIDGMRTKTYYCHPYSSWERGSNENQNKMIRRHYPKGYDFTDTTPAEIHRLEKWINTYPREMFDFCSSAELYENYIKNCCA